MGYVDPLAFEEPGRFQLDGRFQVYVTTATGCVPGTICALSVQGLNSMTCG